MTASQMPILNACGQVGAFLSELLFKFFGLASFLLTLYALILSVVFFKRKRVSLDKCGALMVIFCLFAMTLNLYSSWTAFEGVVQQGGWTGYVLAKNFLSVFNFIGASIIILFFYMVCFLICVENPGVIFKSLERQCKTLGLNLKFLFAASPQNSIGEESLGSSGVHKRGVKGKLLSKLQSYFQRTSLKDSTSYEKDFAEEEFFEKSFAEEESPEVPLSFSLGSSIKRILGYQRGGVQNSPKGEEFKIESFKRDHHLKSIPHKFKDADWEVPSVDVLNDSPSPFEGMSKQEIRNKSELLVSKLSQFNVRGTIVGVKSGPAVTLFEFRPNADIKISKVTELANDLCLALASESVRIIAPIPGRSVVGIETSNSKRDIVFIKDILSGESFWKEDIKIPIVLGRKADGYPMVVDLRKMPHLLIAGSTGSGKSVFVVSMISGFLFRHSPKKLKLILIDPKQVDLAAFNDLPHLLIPPVRDPKKSVNALKWAIDEMNKRYRSMSQFKVRDLEGFNSYVQTFSQEEQLKHQKINEDFQQEASLKSYYFEELPYIVIVVEEFGDLMTVDKSNVEHTIVRLAQMARACGIHLVLAMQSPRKDVVTGLIKTNIPGRISFKVASKMDSRVILDESGAECLLSRGDMLFQSPGISKPIRAHGAYISEEEVERMTQAWKDQSEPSYDKKALKAIETSSWNETSEEEGWREDFEEFDDRYDEILDQVSRMKEISASMLQRKFRLGYPRAARLIEVFEQQGIVSPAKGSKPRKVLI